MYSDQIPVISIVICTYRRFELLQSAVVSLTQQTADREYFEIIIVDNDITPSIEVRQIIQDVIEEVNVIYIHEPQLGLSYARNAGGKASRGKYVGYIDDDAKARSDYISNFIEIQKRVYFDICGGPYYPFYLDQKPKWFLDKYESVELGKARLLQKNEFLNGTNIIFQRTLINDLGWFKTNLGMIGNKIAYGEETSLQMLAWDKEKSLKVYYSPELVILHLAPRKKMNLSDKLRRSFRMGYSQTYLWINQQNEKKEKRKSPFLLIKTFIVFIVKEPINLMFRNRKLYKYWKNYVYEKWPRYFKSFGQEWKLLQDLINGK